MALEKLKQKMRRLEEGRFDARWESRDSPFARHATASFHIAASAKSQFQPISGGLVQTLVTAVGQS